jgi:hypothetical protein
MHKSATKCNKTIGKWCKNKHGASKIIDTFETYHSLVQILTGLKPKLTYAMGRNPHEDFSEDEVDSRYPNIPQDHQGYKKMGKQEDLQ